MSGKLTTAVRGAIVKKLLDATFKEREEALDKEEVVLGDEVFKHHIGANLALIERLPSDYFVTRGSLRAAWPTGERNFRMTSRPTPATFNCWNHKVRIEDSSLSGSVLIAKLTEFDEKKSKLDGDKQTLKLTCEGLVKGVTTIKKLLEVWPEAKDYLPKTEEVMHLPAVRGEDLNALISKVK